MKAIVDALVQVTLYSAAVTAGILLFRFIFKNRISSKLQYLMWWLLILRLLMPVTPDIGLHFNLQDTLLKQAHQAELPAPAPVLDVTPASVPSTQPYYESVAPAVQPDTDVAPSQHVNPAKSTDWYSIVFVVWLLGAIGFLGWLIFVKLRYYESLQHLMAGGPREAYELYDKCCKELGVKPLPLWIVNKSMSPGIAFFGEPVLLVPLSLCNDESRLRFALLHELTHKKRGDHYMTLLLNILRAVYWFDPVVHFAFSELRSDMESACDSDVLAYIGHEHKRGYLTVILDMFSYDTEPILGMSQIRSKRMAKRRMKGAFMKNRTSPAFRAITLCLALAMSVCCLTTACQSAPEKVPPHMAAEQTADPSPEPTLIPEPSAQEPEAIAYTPDAFDRTDPEQAVAEFLARYFDDMAKGNDDFGFSSSTGTMYDGLLQLQDSDESYKNIALLRQWINYTKVLRETSGGAMDRGKFQSLEVTEFGIADQLSGGIMYEYRLKGYFKTTVMGTIVEAGLIKNGHEYVITYVDFPDSKEYRNFCADLEAYMKEHNIDDYMKSAYIEYVAEREGKAAAQFPVAEPEADPSNELTFSDVTSIQSALKALGYLENPSGAYDAVTKTAIEEFQEDNALPSDGIAGAETLALLLSDSAKKGRLQSNYTGDKRIWREPPKDGADGWSSMTANKITAFCGGSVTSTGTECSLGTAAVNPNAIPIGTELYIPGYGYAMAADVNAYKNKTNQLSGEPLNVIDLWFADKEDANSWGSKHDFTILYRSADAQPAREAPTADAIVATAKKQVGKKYVFEASGPDELDPSGLVYHVLNECGIATGRKDCAGYAQNADWSKIESLGDVKAGDILFFYGEDGKIQHAGIYVGDGMMIDASSSYGKVVKRSCNTDYWNRHFAFARRVLSK